MVCRNWCVRAGGERVRNLLWACLTRGLVRCGAAPQAPLRGRVGVPTRLSDPLLVGTAGVRSVGVFGGVLSVVGVVNIRGGVLTVGMGQRQVGLRLDEGLLGRVDAARGDVPRNRWIERAVVRALQPGGGRLDGSNQNPAGNPDVSGPVAAESAGRSGFGCPVVGCGFVAGSPRAVCAVHGRRVS